MCGFDGQVIVCMTWCQCVTVYNAVKSKTNQHTHTHTPLKTAELQSEYKVVPEQNHASTTTEVQLKSSH